MAVRFAVFIATSLDGFIARADGRIDFLDRYHGEDHGYGAFFAGVFAEGVLTMDDGKLAGVR